MVTKVVAAQRQVSRHIDPFSFCPDGLHNFGISQFNRVLDMCQSVLSERSKHIKTKHNGCVLADKCVDAYSPACLVFLVPPKSGIMVLESSSRTRPNRGRSASSPCPEIHVICEGKGRKFRFRHSSILR